MRKLFYSLFICFPFLAFGSDINPGTLKDYPGLFDDWGKNLADSFTGTNFIYHAGAVGITFGMIYSGADRKIQDFFQEKNPFGQTYADVMIISGNFWHFVPGLALYFHGRNTSDIELSGAGAAGCQAVFTAFVVTSVEKYFSGRKFPNKTDHSGFLNMTGWVGTEDEGDFSMKFWDHSLGDRRVSWPSGHTATAFSFVSALYAYYPDENLIAIIGYPLALMMGISTIEGDYHWGSDVAAGVLIGHVIGWTIGKSYRRQVDQKTGKIVQKESDIIVMPLFNSKIQGLALGFKF